MTFIVGFHCLDGLVLCADSEEGDGINKRYMDKLYCRIMPEKIGVCYGGSGDSIAIEKSKNHLFALLNQDINNETKVMLTTEKVLEHMETQYPDISFEILLAQCDFTSQQTALYRTYEHSSAVRSIEAGDFSCIGMDTSLARFFLQSTFDYFMGIKEAMRLGIYATVLMKTCGVGVGGPSIVFTYKKGETEWERHYSPEIDEIESRFPLSDWRNLTRRYWHEKNPDIWQIINDLPVRPSE